MEYPDYELRKRANELFIDGKLQYALDLAKRAMKASPFSLDNYILSARILKVMGNREEANGILRQAIEIADKRIAESTEGLAIVFEYAAKGKILEELGQYPEAAGYYEKALKESPPETGLTIYWYKVASYLGRSLYEEGKFEEAYKTLEKVTVWVSGKQDLFFKNDEDFAYAYYIRAQAATKIDKEADALALYEKFIRIAPKYLKDELQIAKEYIDKHKS